MRWLACLVLVACGEPDSVVVDLGVIVTTAVEVPVIDHPIEAQAGVDVEITVTTYGDGCTTFERTDVEVDGLSVAIQPFDRSMVDGLCDDAFITHEHSATVRFDEVGTATFTAFGYDEGDRFGTVIERTSTLQVR